MNWIKSSEHLPKEYIPILIYGAATCGGNCSRLPMVREGIYRSGKFEFGEYDCSCDVTHWMPLPEPPKE